MGTPTGVKGGGGPQGQGQGFGFAGGNPQRPPLQFQQPGQPQLQLQQPGQPLLQLQQAGLLPSASIATGGGEPGAELVPAMSARAKSR